MKLTKHHITTSLLIVLALLLVINLVTIFKKKPQPVDNRPLIEAYDKIIAAKEELIQLRKEINESLSTQIKSHQQKDSLLLVQLITNQPKYISNEKKYKDIPVRVSSLSVDELKREFADY